MSDLPQPAWFVRLDDAVSGPMTLAELRRLVQSRRVGPTTLVSRDAQKWVTASALPALRDELVGIPSAPPPVPVGSASTTLRPVWIAGGILVGVGGFLLLLVCLGILLSASGNGEPVTNANPVAQAEPAPAVNAVAEGTAATWLALREELSRIRQLKNPQDFAVIASRIERLPTVNVDTDLVQFVLSLSALMRESSLQAQRQSDPSLFVEAIMRGANGDPFGTYNDQRRDQNTFLQRWTEMESYSARLRAVLSQRYGVEFPAI